MQSNSMRLAQALIGRQDMASHSYNTGGGMRRDMGAIKNGQPSLPTPEVSKGFVNLGSPSGGTVNPKGTPNTDIAGMGTLFAVVGQGNNDPAQHVNDMGNNQAHPATQLASYLFANRLTDPTMFYRGG